MDHLDAAQIKAVERYMLNDLSVSEVEEFERHFFDCPQCSEELRTLTIFQENARAIFVEQDTAPVPVSVHVPESTASWWRGFSPLSFSLAAALACLVIGIFAGKAFFAERDGAEAVSAYPLYAQARGEETIVSPATGSKFYTLYLDHTWDGDFTKYRAVLRTASGAEQFAVPVAGGAPGDAIHMLIPTHKLVPGKYVLIILGGENDKETELARFPFTFRFQ